MTAKPFTGVTDPDFEAFWKLYPKKRSKGDASKAWQQLRPNQDVVASILEALQWQPRQWEWRKDEGQFIPLPATWLRGWRWLDECPKDLQKKLPPISGPPVLRVAKTEPVYDFDPEHDLNKQFQDALKGEKS